MDDAIHDLLMHPAPEPPELPQPKRATLPEPVSPQYPELLNDPGPDAPLEKRQWTRQQIYRNMRVWLFPYIRSRVLPGDFIPSRLICSPITSAISIAGTAGHS
jgi:hypothetical protein